MAVTLSKPEISQIKQLMREGGWDTLLRFLGTHIEEIRSEKVIGDTEFHTLRMLHINQGKVDGLLEFIDILDKKTFSSE